MDPIPLPTYGAKFKISEELLTFTAEHPHWETPRKYFFGFAVKGATPNRKSPTPIRKIRIPERHSSDF